MALLASCMELIWLLEQPRQSILEAHRRIDKLWQSITAWKASWWMGCFNGPTAKPHYLICNLFAFCRGMETGSHIRNTFRLAFTYGLFHVCRVTFAHGSSSVCICLDHFRSKEGRAGYLPKAEREKLKGKKLVVKSGNRYTTGDRKALRESQCLVILVWQFLFQTHFQKQSLGLNRVESWTFKGPTHRRWLLGSRLFSRPMVGQTELPGPRNPPIIDMSLTDYQLFFQHCCRDFVLQGDLWEDAPMLEFFTCKVFVYTPFKF